MAELWSYITGEKGTSRVRTYERYEGSPLQVEWYLHGKRIQRSLRMITGSPVRDRHTAMRIADRMADELERGHRQQVRQRLFGVAPGKTVSELFRAMHDAREPTWSDTYRRDQDRFREFWTTRLGKDTPITAVNEPMVEEVVRAELDELAPATRNRYRSYVKIAWSYARKKLKWIEERHDLSAVDFEDPKSRGRAYSTDEVRRLLEALGRVDPVAEWIGHVLWQTGRRLTATRTLRKSDVEVREDEAVITWPEETDKAGKEGVSVVVGRAHQLARALMETGGDYMAGASPPSLDVCEKAWIRDAEEIAGIEHVTGRAWHGIKRRFSGVSKGLRGRDKQSGTLESTLRHHYEPDDDLDAKREVAEALAAEVGSG